MKHCDLIINAEVKMKNGTTLRETLEELVIYCQINNLSIITELMGCPALIQQDSNIQDLQINILTHGKV